MTKKTVSLKLPTKLADEIADVATQYDVSKSSVMRQALTRYLAEQPAQDERSFLARATDLTGCVDGDEDLASDPRHLRGYGR